MLEYFIFEFIYLTLCKQIKGLLHFAQFHPMLHLQVHHHHNLHPQDYKLKWKFRIKLTIRKKISDNNFTKIAYTVSNWRVPVFPFYFQSEFLIHFSLPQTFSHQNPLLKSMTNVAHVYWITTSTRMLYVNWIANSTWA